MRLTQVQHSERSNPVMSALEIEKRGFAIFSDVLGGSDIERIDQQLAATPLPRSRAGMRHALRHPAVREVANDPLLLGIAREILGRDAFPFRATLFDKSPASNWLVVWHQDTALPLRERRDVAGWGSWSVKDKVIYAHAPATTLSQVLALRLHLDDSLPENSPLRVLPGTHTLGVLDDDAIHELSDRMPAVDCLIPRGGILAMRPLLIHASSKSRSTMRRRVLHLEYASTAKLQESLELAIS